MSVELPLANAVFQRGQNNRATIPFRANRPVHARVLRGQEVICDWRKSRTGVPEIPVGGPYTLEVEDSGTKRKVGGLLVGDLWVLAGQSNMDGNGKLTGCEPPSRYVHAFYYDEQWRVARDPLCICISSIDPVHWPELQEGETLEKARETDRLFRDTGGGLGVRFGKEIFKATGIPVGLLVCSHGGTSIEQWSPAKKREGGKSLYGSMLRRINRCGGKVKGVLWYQGESNANAETSKYYKKRMKAFIAALRQELKSPNLPFIQAQIGRFYGDDTIINGQYWNAIQQTQLEIGREVKNMATAATLDLGLSDIIHLDSPSLRILGYRMAELALVLAYGKKAPLALEPSKITCPDKNRQLIQVEYTNVRAPLGPKKGIFGF